MEIGSPGDLGRLDMVGPGRCWMGFFKREKVRKNDILDFHIICVMMFDHYHCYVFS